MQQMQELLSKAGVHDDIEVRVCEMLNLFNLWL